jgi:dienelactone hydrolase
VPAEYCTDLAAIKSRVGLEAVAQATIATHSYVEPPVATTPAKFPLLLFSPGYSTNANQYTALAEELASHGYVVATVDHPLQSAAIAYPDGNVVSVRDASESKAPPMDPEQGLRQYRDRVDVRVADLQLVLEKLAQMNAGELDARFKDRIDLDRVGAVGHSLGGVAAPALAMCDPRVKASLNMDGHAHSLPIIPDEHGAGPRQPFMEITDSHSPPTPSDEQLAKWKVTREKYESIGREHERRYDDLMRTISGGSYRVTVPGASHQSFSDSVLWIAANPKDHQRRTQIVRDYVRAFFDKQLRGTAGTVLDADKSPYAEVTVERFAPEPAESK